MPHHDEAPNVESSCKSTWPEEGFRQRVPQVIKEFIANCKPEKAEEADVYAGRIVVDARDAQRAIDGFRERDEFSAYSARQMQARELAGEYLGIREYDSESSEARLLDQILASAAILEVKRDGDGPGPSEPGGLHLDPDPLEGEELRGLISALRAPELRVDARPFFRMITLNHWAAQPGEDRQDASTSSAAAFERIKEHFAAATDPKHAAHDKVGLEGWPVYVIDSGYNKDNPWHDLIGGRIYDNGVWGDGAHGTFVTGLIAAMSPKSCIQVLKTDYSDLQPSQQQQNELSVSMAVLEAIARYIDAGPNKPAVINLSLGTYGYDLDVEGEPGNVKKLVPLTLEFQLDILEKLPLLRFVAAGGNDRGHERHVTRADSKESAVAYPASDRRVIGVGAGDGKTQDKEHSWQLWHDEDGPNGNATRKHTSEDTEPWYPRLDDLAPGLDIIGPIPMSTEFLTGDARWSGSSFAAALYSGHVAAHGRPPLSRTAGHYEPITFV